MKILLVQSYTMTGEPPIFPLGLCYVASKLADNEVSLFDMNTAIDPYNDLQAELIKVNPNVVGISLRNIKVANPGKHASSFDPHKRAINIIRKTLPEVILIAGGSALSLYIDKIMEKCPEIDFAIFGEGEYTFPELLSCLNNPERILGVYYRENGNTVYTGQRKWIPADKICHPKRNLVAIEEYTKIPFSIGVQTKRGCSLRCIHCSDRYLIGQRLRFRNPIEIVDEIEQLKENDGVKTFSFVDQIFNIPMDHASAICQEMIRRNLSLKWTAFFNEKYISTEFLKVVKAAGCAYLSFSPDSAADNVLKSLKKNISARDLRQTYILAKKVNMKAEYSFMINSPGETVFTLIKTLFFIIKARLALGNNFMLHNLLMTTPIRIYPHTEIGEMSLKEGLITRNTDLLESTFYNPPPIRYVVSGLDYFTRLTWRMKTAWDNINSGR